MFSLEACLGEDEYAFFREPPAAAAVGRGARRARPHDFALYRERFRHFDLGEGALLFHIAMYETFARLNPSGYDLFDLPASRECWPVPPGTWERSLLVMPGEPVTAVPAGAPSPADVQPEAVVAEASGRRRQAADEDSDEDFIDDEEGEAQPMPLYEVLGRRQVYERHDFGFEASLAVPPALYGEGRLCKSYEHSSVPICERAGSRLCRGLGGGEEEERAEMQSPAQMARSFHPVCLAPEAAGWVIDMLREDRIDVDGDFGRAPPPLVTVEQSHPLYCALADAVRRQWPRVYGANEAPPLDPYLVRVVAQQCQRALGALTEKIVDFEPRLIEGFRARRYTNNASMLLLPMDWIALLNVAVIAGIDDGVLRRVYRRMRRLFPRGVPPCE